MLAPIFIGASMPNHMFMGVLFIRGMIYTPITKEFPTPTRCWASYLTDFAS